MPTLQEIYESLQHHEDMSKTAAVKKTAIESTKAPGQSGVAAAIDDVIGDNVLDTKVRIKKKLEDAAGAAKASEGLTAHPEEMPSQAQAPIQGDKMPPSGDKGTSVSSKVSAKLEDGAEKEAKHGKDGKKPLPPFMKKKAEEQSDEEKIAVEHFSAGRIIEQGFVHELGELLG